LLGEWPLFGIDYFRFGSTAPRHAFKATGWKEAESSLYLKNADQVHPAMSGPSRKRKV